MFDDVLVPTDGSPGMLGPVARAVDLARIGDGTVHTLFVIDSASNRVLAETESGPVVRRALKERGDEAMRVVSEVAGSHGLAVERQIREGVAYREILDYTRTADVDLVVMGTHGRDAEGERRLGSTTERVAVRSETPVLSVPLDAGASVPEGRHTMIDHILVPTDGSDPAERAAEQAIEFAERYGADLHVVYAVDITTYGYEDTPRSIVGLLKEGGENAVESVAAAARDRNLPVTADVLRGDPTEQILEYADGVDADLIAMGTRGRSSSSDGLMGSITGRILRRAPMPILTVG